MTITPRQQRHFKIRADLSLRVIKAWLELLRLGDGVVKWEYWDIEQDIITEVFTRYSLNECMGAIAPFTKNRFNCETLLKSAERYLSQSDLDRTLPECVRTVEEGDDSNAELRQKVDALIQTGQDDELKSIVA